MPCDVIRASVPPYVRYTLGRHHTMLLMRVPCLPLGLSWKLECVSACVVMCQWENMVQMQQLMTIGKAEGCVGVFIYALLSRAYFWSARLSCSTLGWQCWRFGKTADVCYHSHTILQRQWSVLGGWRSHCYMYEAQVHRYFKPVAIASQYNTIQQKFNEKNWHNAVSQYKM